jgi:hypothetical protein
VGWWVTREARGEEVRDGGVLPADMVGRPPRLEQLRLGREEGEEAPLPLPLPWQLRRPESFMLLHWVIIIHGERNLSCG